MATVTPNFNWPVPTSTDLVKDGATAIEALGDSIDASLVDLKGGTTGQVLSKTSGTDMDFTWVTSDDANAIQNTIVDAKGDLIAATAADTPARLAVGANDTVLTADSTTATGLKWATVASANLSINAQTATYTAVLSDASKLITMSVGSANNFQIPTNASVAFAIGTTIQVISIGAGQTTIQAVTSGTTTISSTGSTATAPKLRDQFSAATCIKVGTDLWYVVGDIV